MDRRRTPKRRGLSFMETRSGLESVVGATNLQSSAVNRLQPLKDYVEITDCKDRPHICGKEAACRSLPDKSSKCVCPHDLSPPTSNLTCPNRITVPLTPSPIHNIIFPSGNVTNSTTPRTEVESTIRTKNKVPEIVGIAVAFVAVLLILIGIIYYIRKRSYGLKLQRNETPMNLKKGLLLANKYTPNPQYFPCGSLEIPILPRECLVFLNDIGEGCFGKVYKGEWQNGNSKEIVAVKVLKESASREVEEDFMHEVQIMSTFEHPNILTLKGMVLRDATSSPWMVFEFMPYGDLAEVLRANSHHLRAPTPGLPPLTRESLMWIVKQITSGMAYLSSQRFVHRDLACRNCLVSDGLVIKIADFGMSRDIYTCDYYKVGGSRLLPVRWMAPECIMFGRFTLESDIWSYGVVLWEVFSLGKQPFFGHTNDEAVKLILQGIMLIPPDDCPAFICEIMRDCWKSDPKDRIQFTKILERLERYQDTPDIQESLPRPPQGPVTIRAPDILDRDGYLLPAPTIPREYFQALPVLTDCAN